MFTDAKHNRTGYFKSVLILVVSVMTALPVLGQVINNNDPALLKIDIVEHLGQKIDLNIDLTNDDGMPVGLSDYFSDDKPVLLIMAYYYMPTVSGLMIIDGCS